ncbi:MAG TPA: hypothetical protein VHM88_25095, partial [Candidatus Acidoferrales bacterium]|nr:hypothetical protein [Candidatus Acidoferrales bacterium]
KETKTNVIERKQIHDAFLILCLLGTNAAVRLESRRVLARMAFLSPHPDPVSTDARIIAPNECPANEFSFKRVKQRDCSASLTPIRIFHLPVAPRKRSSPDFSPEVSKESQKGIEKGRFLRHNCVVEA